MSDSIRAVVGAIAALVACSILVTTFSFAFERAAEAQARFALPEWVQWESRQFQVDLDNDGVLESVSLHDKTLEITDADGGIATLPEGRYTSEVFVQDVDYDGKQEVITLTWKQGSFGPAHPFWHTENDNQMTQHIFLFTYEEGVLKDKWLSSDIRMEVAQLTMDPYGIMRAILHDGSEELIEWQGWGLSFLDEANPSWNEEAYNSASILVMGDVIAHNVILNQAQKHATTSGDYDFSFLFENIAPFVRQADIALVNQEGPLITDERKFNGDAYSFGTPAQLALAYQEAGFDVLALANNHIMDRGLDGFFETIDVARESRLSTTGYGPTILECNDMRIGLMNATYWPIEPDSSIDYSSESLVTTSEQTFAQTDETNAPTRDQSSTQVDETESQPALTAQESQRQRSLRVQTTLLPSALRADVAALHDTTDFVLCFLHVGEEYVTEPTQEDKVLIASLIDAGADAVVCAHPHVVQPVERVVTAQGNTGIVFYSLGNLVSNQVFPGTQEGLIAQFIISKPKDDPLARAQIVTYQAIPTTCVMTQDKTTVFIEK